MSSAFFLNFFWKIFFENYERRHKLTVLGGEETTALNPAQIDFFGHL